MKNWMQTPLAGACVIGICIIIAGNIIANRLPDVLSGSFTGTLMDGGADVSGERLSGDFLSLYEASAYLRMGDEDVTRMVESGELQGTYFTVNGYKQDIGIGNYYVFSKEKLEQWAKDRIPN